MLSGDHATCYVHKRGPARVGAGVRGVGVWGDDRSDGAGTSHLSHQLGQPAPCRLNSSRNTQLNVDEIVSQWLRF